ncbi:putative methyltransferase At1g29790 [Silene latifolia]|uniref:putative methyltransferase At1g29790 n=1 Tax=Silene latifolia TaxID=37657 RepID=UPI003D76F3F3
MAAMSFTMGLNLILLVAMVATNIISLYHLSSTTNFFKFNQKSQLSSTTQVPNHLLRQLHTIRATINHLTRLHPPSRATNVAVRPSDLVMLSHFSPIPSSCHDFPELLYQYMNYTVFELCPKDAQLAESLILRGCHPLPRRRCFSRTPANPRFNSLDSNVIWSSYTNPNANGKASCRSFKCLDPKLGLNGNDLEVNKQEFMVYKSDLDLTIPQLLDIAKRAGSVLRLGIDIGGGSGSFAAKMQERNVTVLTTTMNLGVPFSEVNALRGLVAMHTPLQQRLPVFDGVVDLVRCGHAVNRWIPVVMLEFLMFDVDRVLRGGGFLWVDHFFSKDGDLEKVYKPLINKLGYKIVKWATGNKMDSSGIKNGEVYLTALLQKPKSR